MPRTLLASLAFFLAAPLMAQPMTPHRGDFRITGYLPWYREQQIDDIRLDRLTDVVYFSMGVNDDGTIDPGRISTTFLTELIERAAQSNTKVHVSLGGGGQEFAFPEVVTDAARRATLATELRDFALAHDIAGIDLDWEPFPSTQADRDNYSQLMRDIHDVFEPHGLELSVAVPGRTPWIQPSAHDAINNLHIMSYDHAAPHSTFEAALGDVAFWQDQGIDHAKINLGVPFYGRDADRNAFTYQHIMSTYQPPPNSDEAGGIHFNGIETIKRKARYAFDTGLGGLMIWELGQDTTDNTSLLQAAYDAIYQPGYIPIRNPSFEYVDVLDNANPRADEQYGQPTGWTITGQVTDNSGVFDPTSGQFPGTRGDGTQGSLPDGGQVAAIEVDAGRGRSSTLEQSLAVEVQRRTIYTLSFSAGRRADADSPTHFVAELLSGDTVIASWADPVDPAAGEFERATLHHVTTGDAQGELAIRFRGADASRQSAQTMLDAVSLHFQRVGDMNADGTLDAFDTPPFELALTDPQAFTAAYPLVPPHLLGDLNADGLFNTFDVAAFERRIRHPGRTVPEPALTTLTLLTLLAIQQRRTTRSVMPPQGRRTPVQPAMGKLRLLV